MRKEVILAVIIGVFLGGVILYGINLANKSVGINTEKNEAINDLSQENSKVTETSNNQISIIYPQNNSVLTEAQITLKGAARPNSNIAIITESDDILTTSNETGNFSSEINLISGENLITITSVDEKLATTSASIYIIRTATLPQ